MTRRSDIPMRGKTRADHAALAGVIVGAFLGGVASTMLFVGLLILGV